MPFLGEGPAAAITGGSRLFGRGGGTRRGERRKTIQRLPPRGCAQARGGRGRRRGGGQGEGQGASGSSGGHPASCAQARGRGRRGGGAGGGGTGGAGLFRHVRRGTGGRPPPRPSVPAGAAEDAGGLGDQRCWRPPCARARTAVNPPCGRAPARVGPLASVGEQKKRKYTDQRGVAPNTQLGATLQPQCPCQGGAVGGGAAGSIGGPPIGMP